VLAFGQETPKTVQTIRCGHGITACATQFGQKKPVRFLNGDSALYEPAIYAGLEGLGQRQRPQPPFSAFIREPPSASDPPIRSKSYGALRLDRAKRGLEAVKALRLPRKRACRRTHKINGINEIKAASAVCANLAIR